MRTYLCNLAYDTSDKWVGGGLGWHFEGHEECMKQAGEWELFAYWKNDPPQKQYNAIVIVDVKDHETFKKDIEGILDINVSCSDKTDFKSRTKEISMANVSTDIKNQLSLAGFNTNKSNLYEVLAELIG